MRLKAATHVGIHGDCSAKNARFSISIIPLNASPVQKAASAAATTGVWSGVNSPRS